MSNGFTTTGQPIQGRKYTIIQGQLSIPVTIVGKAYGKAGNSDLVAVLVEESPSGGRDWFDWPIEAAEGADPVRFVYGWQEDDR